jgi:hypothetical protein
MEVVSNGVIIASKLSYRIIRFKNQDDDMNKKTGLFGAALLIFSSLSIVAPIDHPRWSASIFNYFGGQPAGNEAVIQTVNADSSFYLI